MCSLAEINVIGKVKGARVVRLDSKAGIWKVDGRRGHLPWFFFAAGSPPHLTAWAGFDLFTYFAACFKCISSWRLPASQGPSQVLACQAKGRLASPFQHKHGGFTLFPERSI